MIAIGIGCRKECPAQEIVELIQLSLRDCDIKIQGDIVIASGWMKAGDASLQQAAQLLGLSLCFMSRSDMEAASVRVLTHSEASFQAYGLPSVAETAALAAVGSGSALVRPRSLSANASCAIATKEDL